MPAFPAFPDEAADKAQFKKLYAEFKDLYANSKEVDPIIEVAEKLYKIAPKAFGKRSQQYAVVTYNVANLYDEKGGTTNNADEKHALDLYKKYFRLLDRLKTPKDKNYINQYLKFVTTEQNVKLLKSDFDLTRKILTIANKSDMTELEIADLEYYISRLKNTFKYRKTMRPILEHAYKVLLKERGPDHLKAGVILLLLAEHEALEKRPYINDLERLQAQYEKPLPKVEAKYLEALRIFKKNGEKGKASANTAKRMLAQLYYDQHQSEKAKKYHQTSPTLKTREQKNHLFPIVRVPPQYPTLAIQNNLEGIVLLEFTVDKQGNTKDILVIETSHIIFKNTAIRAVSNYKYKPIIVDGEPVEVNGVRVTIELQFAK